MKSAHMPMDIHTEQSHDAAVMDIVWLYKQVLIQYTALHGNLFQQYAVDT